MKPKLSREAKPKNDKKNGSAPPRDFLTVAVGASAGGLEAFTELVRSIPDDTGMAFVLVQHLDPKHHSILTELVAKETSMEVVEITDGMVIQPNHVYVIPPNTVMTIANRTLNLTPRDDSRGQTSMTVDVFMRALAEDQGSKSIGVILSGSGSDGTLGLMEIQAQGGVTFAQDESTAKHDGMPRSAIAAGAVDFVLPPKGIARELTRIGRHPFAAAHSRIMEGAELVPGEHTGLHTIFQLLRKATGVDFTYYRDTTIRRRIQRRMVVHKIEQLEEYIKYIQQNPAEVKALYQDMLINVTSFFRNPRVFDVLKSTVFPQIMKNRSSESPVRIWAPGCASGEETYSLAISFLEFLGDKSPQVTVQLFGTDVSENSITKARTGYYPENIQGDVSQERLRRHFVKLEGGYRISKNIRDMCIFAQHNLLSDPPFSQMDLICCRNLLIYLEPVLQKKVISLFHYALRPVGFLVLGTSEGVGTSTNLFSLEDRTNKIFSKKAAAARPLVTFSLNKYIEPHEQVGLPRPPVKPPESNWNYVEAQREFDRRLLSQYAPAAVFVNEDLEIIHSRGSIDRYLKLAPGRASLSILKLAREGLLFDLRNALNRAKKENTPVRKQRIQIKNGNGNGHGREINIEISRVHVANLKEAYFMVVFEDALPDPPRTKHRQSAASKRETEVANRRVVKLEQELAATKEYLHSVIEGQEATNEELQSANEEILSSNEELQSTNEELETAKEELQSANEELSTVNDELRNRNFEITQINNDLTNLLASVNIGIVMLASDLTIRRFTPPAQKILGLIPSDVGRPFGNINPSLDGADLQALSLGVMENFAPVEREVRDRNGEWFYLKIFPYRTPENKIDGVIITLMDNYMRVTEGSSRNVKQRRSYVNNLLAGAREYILILDTGLRLSAASQAFFEDFGIDPVSAKNVPLTQLSDGRWDNPALQKALEKALKEKSLRLEVEFDLDVPGTGPRQFRALMNYTETDGTQLLALRLQDLQGKMQLENALCDQAEILDLFHDAVILRDMKDHIRFWNRSAQLLYGWRTDEVFGKKSRELLRTGFTSSVAKAEGILLERGTWEGEVAQFTRDGKSITVFSRWVLIRDGSAPDAVLEINREVIPPPVTPGAKSSSHNPKQSV